MIIHSSKNPIILNEGFFKNKKIVKDYKDKINKISKNTKKEIDNLYNNSVNRKTNILNNKEKISIPELPKEIFDKYYSYFETAYKEAIKNLKAIESKYPLVKKKKIIDYITSFKEAMTYHPNSLPIEQLIPIYATSNGDHHMYIAIVNFDSFEDVYDYENPNYDDNNRILKPGITQEFVDQLESFMEDIGESKVNGYGELYYEEDKATIELIHINKSDKFNKLKDSLK